MEYLVYIKIAALIIQLLQAKNGDVTPADLAPIVKTLEPLIDKEINVSELKTEDKESIKVIVDFLFNRGKDEKDTNHAGDIVRRDGRMRFA